jgi:hypothetical protein
MPYLDEDKDTTEESNFIKNNFKVIARSSVVFMVLLSLYLAYPIYCDAPRA